MIAGGAAYFLFWGRSIIADMLSDGFEVPWMVALGVHAVAIFGLTIGLMALARQPADSGAIQVLTWVGVGLAVAGLLTVQPLIFVGFGIVGLAVLDGRAPIAGAALILGSVLGLAAYATGVRSGFEDAPALTGPQEAMVGVSVLAIALGSLLIGVAQFRSAQVRHGGEETDR